MINQQTRFCPMCHNTPQVCQCNPNTILPDRLQARYAPPQMKKEWVGLTKEERRDIFDLCERDDRGYVAAMVEAKLKEKNT